MTQWEYKVERLDVMIGSSSEPGDTHELAMLIALGEGGWELVSVKAFSPLGLFYYFKRPLKQQP